ncbi:patatin-like phospholipase family protein [Spirosoma arcticum]
MNTPVEPRPDELPPVSIPSFFEWLPNNPAHVLYPTQPFTNIAVAASGGGFRAAAYMLGTLSYLNHAQFDQKPLLAQVTYLASASGGSLATAFYRKALFDNQPFGGYYQTMTEFLTGTKTVQAVSKLLADDTAWPVDGKRRNLINAFAKVYDQQLEGLTLGDFFTSNPAVPVQEMCFNTTEFYQGLPFRFQTRQTGMTNLIGNKYLNFQAKGIDAAKKIKIGDIIAASSCFPAGFEPMRFPDDFAHDQLPKDVLQRAIHFPERPPVEIGKNYPKRTFGLMDGGIVDNQAIGSMLEADRRRTKVGACFTIVIVTDVSNQYIPPFVPGQPTAGKPWQQMTVPGVWKGVRRLTNRLFLLGLFAFVVSLLLVILATNVWLKVTGALFIVPSLLISLLDWLAGQAERKATQSVKTFTAKSPLLSDKGIRPLLSFLANLPLGTLVGMLSERIQSVVILASDLFLKRIRRADYTQLYEDPAWQFRRVANFIYDLSEGDQPNREAPLNKDTDTKDTPKKETKPEKPDWRGPEKIRLTPLPALAALAEKARLMDTTLWFDEAHQDHLDAVIATGQFTTCYNLIKYLFRLEQEEKGYGRLTDDVKQSVQQLKTQLLTDWDRFQQDPLWLHTHSQLQN